MAMQQHMMQKAMEQQLLTVANAMEEKIDAEMAELDELENDEDALERIRQKRLMELKNHQDKRNEYLRAGHGKLRNVWESFVFVFQNFCKTWLNFLVLCFERKVLK